MRDTAQPVKTFPFEQRMLAELNTENYTSLVDMFQRACIDFESRVAFSALGQDITFGDVERMSRNFAAYLVNEAGLVRGDRIAIQLPNIGQYPIVAWGALRAGLVIVNTNPLYTPR